LFFFFYIIIMRWGIFKAPREGKIEPNSTTSSPPVFMPLPNEILIENCCAWAPRCVFLPCLCRRPGASAPPSPPSPAVKHRRVGWGDGLRRRRRGRGSPRAERPPNPFALSLPRASVSPGGCPASPGHHGNGRMLPGERYPGSRGWSPPPRAPWGPTRRCRRGTAAPVSLPGE